MYSYSPSFHKKKEKLITLFMGIFGAVTYGVSILPFIVFPILFQIVAFISFTGMIMVGALCLMRRYTYEIRENGERTLDFVITEYYGRRVTVVCRVGLDSVETIFCLTKESKPQFLQMKKERAFYNYTGVLFDEERYCVELSAHGERFFVLICADETLVRLLNEH